MYSIMNHAVLSMFASRFNVPGEFHAFPLLGLRSLTSRKGASISYAITSVASGLGFFSSNLPDPTLWCMELERETPGRQACSDQERSGSSCCRWDGPRIHDITTSPRSFATMATSLMIHPDNWTPKLRFWLRVSVCLIVWRHGCLIYGSPGQTSSHDQANPLSEGPKCVPLWSCLRVFCGGSPWASFQVQLSLTGAPILRQSFSPREALTAKITECCPAEAPVAKGNGSSKLSNCWMTTLSVSNWKKIPSDKAHS